MANEHIKTAIGLYATPHKSFHSVLSWHVLHGLVVVDSDHFFLGYFCRRDDVARPRLRCEADTLFVSYFGGNLRRAIPPTDMPWIAWQRSFKGIDYVRTWSADRFNKHIQKLTN